MHEFIASRAWACSANIRIIHKMKFGLKICDYVFIGYAQNSTAFTFVVLN